MAPTLYLHNSVTSRRDMGPSAPHRVTPEWQARVRRLLKQPGRSQNWLAKKIGVSQGAISGLLAPHRKSSRYVDAVCDVLAIPPPGVQDSREAQFIAIGRELRAKDPHGFDRLVEDMEDRLRLVRERED